MPVVTSTPRAHSLIQVEALRQQLTQAAELATDQAGSLDVRRVPVALRDAFVTLGGRSPSAFANHLDRALDVIDRADTGGTHGHIFGDGTGRIEDAMTDRRGRNIAADKVTSPILGRIAALLRHSNYKLDADERVRVEHDPGVHAVLVVADAMTNASAEALAKRHFTGKQVLHRDYTTIAPPNRWTERKQRCGDGYMGADAGALKDIDVVLVRHEATGTWLSTRVNDDGSYRLPLGERTGELSVWYQPKSGERFFGGNVNMFGSTETDSLQVSAWRMIPDDMDMWPLVYAPRF